MKTFVIGEAASAWRYGSNHLNKALAMISVAVEAGCNAVKFQWVSDPRQMERRRKVPVGTYDILAWPKNWLDTLKKECDIVGIEFMCTVFLPQDVALIAPYVQRFKVASLEALDMKLIDIMTTYFKPIYVSTGCLNEEENDCLIGDAPDSWKQVQFLACTASYPAPLEAMNLSSILEVRGEDGMRERYGYAGLSDHSANVLTGALAVACGAEIVEVHFRLSRTPQDNPDYPHSLSPERLEEYVRNIRLAEVMLGDGVKKIEPCEEALLPHRVEG